MEGTNNTYDYYSNGISNSNAGSVFGINVADTNAEYNFIAVNNTSSHVGGYYGGGALYIGTSVGTVNGVFIDNYASALNGGAIVVNNANAVVVGSINGIFIGNTAKEQGGAIYTRRTINSVDANFISNSANNGGAISIVNTAGSYIGSIEGSFIANSAVASGGAIYNDSLNASYSVGSICAEFYNNTAGTNGGAIYNTAMMDSVEGIFMSNSAGTNGGAVYNSGTINFVANTMNTVFTGNTVNGASNAIYNSGTATFTASKGYSIIVNDAISGSSGTMSVSGEGTTVFNNAVASQAITVDSGATLALGSVSIDNDSYSADLSASSLTVSGTLSLALSDAGTIELCDVLFNTGSALVLDMSDIFGDFSLDITLADGSDLSSFTVYLDDNTTQIINLEEGVTALSSEYYSDLSVSLSGTTYTISGTAVPEPSTYAMIFGVVALGFAYYRRRK